MKNSNSRKKEHIRHALYADAEYGSAGFEKILLTHKAFPEIDFAQINLETNFLGKRLKFPIIIEAITGGFDEGGKVNEILSEIASEFGIGFMVGSQRPMMENFALADTYNISGHPPVIIGNIGAVQLNYGMTYEDIVKIVKYLKADAIAFHTNPLQECLQPAGNRNFKNLKKKINEISRNLRDIGIKVLVKEVGSGLNYEDVNDLDVDCIDVAGFGGTNWAIIEGKRDASKPAEKFYNWGISTVESIQSVMPLKDKRNLEITASGGIRNGVDAAKCFALGADVVGMALPFLKEIYKDENGNITDKINKETASQNLRKFLNKFIEELKIALFLTGSKNIKEIKEKYSILYK